MNSIDHKKSVKKYEGKKKIVTGKNKKLKSNKPMLESTFTRIDVISVNNSVLTQRVHSCSKPKVCSLNPQTQKTVRLKQSSKKLIKPKVSSKTSRQTQYAKLKASQLVKSNLNEVVQRKMSLNQKKTQKRSKSGYNTAFNSTAGEDNTFKHVQINNIHNITTFLKKETDKITQIKENSDSFLLAQMSKAQKQLIQKIKNLQHINLTNSRQNNEKFDQIKQKNTKQVQNYCKQIKYLNSKIQVQQNKNTTLQKKVIYYQKDIQQLKASSNKKDDLIRQLQQKNTILSKQNNQMKTKLTSFQSQMNGLQQKIFSLNKVKIQLQEKINLHRLQKDTIKRNSKQILQILRQEFGEDFNQCIANA